VEDTAYLTVDFMQRSFHNSGLLRGLKIARFVATFEKMTADIARGGCARTPPTGGVHQRLSP
jgi:hypothetical protein